MYDNEQEESTPFFNSVSNTWKADQEERQEWNEAYEANIPALNKELDEVIKATPLQVKEFPVTGEQVDCSFLQYSQNTVYEYTMRYASLCCYGGFIVEYKYKDRHHLKDEVWVNKWIEMFKNWRGANIVAPVVFGSGVFRLDLDLLDVERNQAIHKVAGGKYRVLNDNPVDMLFTKEAVAVHNHNAFHHDEGFENGIPKRDWSAHDNLKHQYTLEEIENLTARTCYLFYLFPSHEINQQLSHINEERYDKGMTGLSVNDHLNGLTGNFWFVQEGRLPQVVFQLEVPQQRNWEEEALKRRTML